MSWNIRHEGSPRSIEGLTLPQVLEGLRDGLWEPTDEVMGPDDRQWIAMEAHPRLAEVVADLEPPPPHEEDDETRLDMNPLIDVSLVLLIFFILTTTYETIRKVLDMPSATAAHVKSKLMRVTPDKVKQVMIKVSARVEDGKTVVKVEDQPVPLREVANALKQYVQSTRKTELLIDADDQVDWETVVSIQDAAKGAGIQKAYFLTRPAKK